jgi:hypothetical protein
MGFGSLVLGWAAAHLLRPQGKAAVRATQAQWLSVPRVAGAKTNRRARASAQVDEICVMFMGHGGDARQIARLVHRSRATHVQYDYGTRRPFPLHEALLLGNSGTL